jgi:hypothetical protein
MGAKNLSISNSQKLKYITTYRFIEGIGCLSLARMSEFTYVILSYSSIVKLFFLEANDEDP